MCRRQRKLQRGLTAAVVLLAICLGGQHIARAGSCVGAAYAICGAQTEPITVDILFGSQRTGDLRESLAIEAWDHEIGEPVRWLSSDADLRAELWRLLSDFVGTDHALLPTPPGPLAVFKAGADAALPALFVDPDDRGVRDLESLFLGVRDVGDLAELSFEPLTPGANGLIELRLGRGSDAADSDSFDAADSDSFDAADSDSFDAADSDSFNDMDSDSHARVPVPPVPEPAPLVLLGVVLAGLGFFRDRKRGSRPGSGRA